MVVIDAGAHYELVQVIRCGFKLGSVERSTHYWSLRAFKQELTFLSLITLTY
jgi:hypothetical protein